MILGSKPQKNRIWGPKTGEQHGKSCCIASNTVKENECYTFGNFRCKMDKGITFIFFNCMLENCIVLTLVILNKFSSIKNLMDRIFI